MARQFLVHTGFACVQTSSASTSSGVILRPSLLIRQFSSAACVANSWVISQRSSASSWALAVRGKSPPGRGLPAVQAGFMAGKKGASLVSACSARRGGGDLAAEDVQDRRNWRGFASVCGLGVQAWHLITRCGGDGFGAVGFGAVGVKRADGGAGPDDVGPGHGRAEVLVGEGQQVVAFLRGALWSASVVPIRVKSRPYGMATMMRPSGPWKK